MSKTRNLADVASGTITGNLSFSDNEKAIFGTGSDLEIYHSGSDNMIEGVANEYLFIKHDNLLVRDLGNKDQIRTAKDGAVTLYHNSGQKLATTSTGVDVTGTVQADQFNNDEALPDVRPSLLLDFANSKTLDPRITFSRGSTATYYDGVTTAKAEENLLTYSQEFDNSGWTKGAASITANQLSAPDGTTTADLFTADGSSAQHYLSEAGLTFTADNYVFSIFAKKGTNDFFQIRFNSASGSGRANFDLNNGTTGGVSGVTATITDVGNGWYRCTAMEATNATTSGGIQMSLIGALTDGSIPTNTLSTTIYLWGAQIEQRSAPTAYTPTTTAPVVKYQPVLQTAASGAARFDHDPVTGESKGLLIEESRTNLIKYSGDLNAATANTGHGWIFGSTLSSFFSYTPAQKIAPDGTQTGVEFVSTANTSQGLFLRSAGISFGAATYTASIWVYVPTQTGVNNWGMLVDFQDTESTLVDGVTSFDQWHRISVTVTISATKTFMDFNIRRNNISPVNSDFFKFYVWGAQVEEGSSPTSYIPTSGSTVTRAVDAAAITGSNFTDWYSNANGLTILAQIGDKGAVDNGDDQYRRIYTIGDGTVDNYFTLHGQPSGGYWRYRMDSLAIDNAVQAAAYTSVSMANNQKVAVAFDTNDFAISVAGLAPQTDSSFPMPTLTKLFIGANEGGSANVLIGTIKKIAIYPKRLPNATLQAMTTE